MALNVCYISVSIPLENLSADMLKISNFQTSRLSIYAQRKKLTGGLKGNEITYKQRTEKSLNDKNSENFY